MQLVQILTNRGTQIVMLGVDNPGRNWHAWSSHLGTQLIQFLDGGTQLLLPHLLGTTENKIRALHPTSLGLW